MKNSIRTLFPSVVQWFCSLPRSQRELSPTFPSRAEPALPALSAAEGSQSKGQGAGKAAHMTSPTENPPSLTPEQFRRMLEEALAGPSLARQVLGPLAGTAFPIQGGQGCAHKAREIGGGEGSDREFGADCNGGDFYFPGNVGIGVTNPGNKLDVSGDIRMQGGARSLRWNDGATAERLLTQVSAGWNFEDGNVGIGTGTPGGKLTIYNAGAGGGFLFDGSTVDNAGGIIFKTPSNGYKTAILSHGGENSLLLRSLGTAIHFQNSTGQAALMTILENGNVGIGTPGPGDKLHIYTGSGNAYLRTEANNGAGAVRAYTFGTNTSDFNFHLRDATGDYDIITALYTNGNVGIGTTAPSTKLDVNGHIAANAGYLYTGDGFNGAVAARQGNLYVVSNGTGAVLINANGNYLYPGQVGGQGGTGGLAVYSGGTSSTQQAQIGGTGNTWFTSGNVGIGTTIPSNTLQVVGDVQIGSGPSARKTLLFGTNAPKQINYGPEMITGATTTSDPDNRRVVLWAGRADQAQAQFLLNSTGMLEWGPGGNDPILHDQDSSLKREETTGEMVLINDKAFVVGRSPLAGGQEVVRLNTDPADTNIVDINNAGGAATLDVKSASASVPTIRASQSTASAIIFRGRVGLESQPRFEIDASGKLFWGPGGGSLVDVSLYRNAADQLRTDDSFVVGGNLTVLGTKSSMVHLRDGRTVALYALESPENWFEDFGSGLLDRGVAWVPLDPLFCETVNSEMDYHVFLTPNGECEGLYVARKTAAGFEVRELRGGKTRVAFDYRILAHRLGFEAVRLEEVPHIRITDTAKVHIEPMLVNEE